MAYRTTLFFQVSAQGWSESFLNMDTGINESKAAALALLAKRKQLLGDNVSCTYLRVSETDPQRDSFLLSVAPVDGQSNLGFGDSDPVATAMLFIGSTSSNFYKRHFWMRGVPDSQVIAGNISASPAFITASAQMRTLLISGKWAIGSQAFVPGARATILAMRNLTGGYGQLDVPIASGIAYGDVIIIRGGKYAQGLEGRHRVFGVTDTTVRSVTIRTPYNLAGYTFGATLELASLSKFSMAEFSFERVGSRKTGRPFGLPVGRRSAVRQA